MQKDSDCRGSLAVTVCTGSVVIILKVLLYITWDIYTYIYMSSPKFHMGTESSFAYRMGMYICTKFVQGFYAEVAERVLLWGQVR